MTSTAGGRAQAVPSWESLQLQLKLFTGSIERLSEMSPVSAINPAGGALLSNSCRSRSTDGLTYRLELSLLQSAGVTTASYTQDFAVNPPAS